MLHFLDPFRGIDTLSVMIKFIVAVVLGGMIGLERSYRNKPAGVRTHILVSIGATVASLTGLYIELASGMPSDITRIGAAVVSGLSFLGVGTIVVTKSYDVKGLTTAAGLWASGIVGIATGLGFYEGAVIAGLLVLCSELSVDLVRGLIRHEPVYNVEVLTRQKDTIAKAMRLLKDRHISINSLKMIFTEVDGEPYYLANLHLRIRDNLDRKKIYDDMAKVEGVEQVLEIEKLTQD